MRLRWLIVDLHGWGRSGWQHMRRIIAPALACQPCARAVIILVITPERHYWQDQPAYVEIWLEKDSVSGSLEPVTSELGITMRAARGFNSLTRVHEVAEHLCAIQKPKFIYYLGDHDPSGEDMDRSPQKLIGDNAYDSDRLGADLRFYGIEVIAPHRRNRKNSTQDRRRLKRYRRRWKIERLFAWLQNFRRLVVTVCEVRTEVHTEVHTKVRKTGTARTSRLCLWLCYRYCCSS